MLRTLSALLNKLVVTASHWGRVAVPVTVPVRAGSWHLCRADCGTDHGQIHEYSILQGSHRGLPVRVGFRRRGRVAGGGLGEKKG